MTKSTSNILRRNAVVEAMSRSAREVKMPRDEKGGIMPVSAHFGVNTFDSKKMREKLHKEVYSKLVSAVKLGKKLDTDVAHTIAQAVQEWAMSQGATHFCHWFQPQTGATAEKHDTFFSFDGEGRPMESFTASQLIQSEPDASSFPSGGMRNTFEARGYTAWDPSSPMFIMESGGSKTLCVPSVFISYHGDALDEKTPLLRSIEALSEKAKALLELMGDKDIHRVITTLGTEQEYFLIDRAFYAQRQDLIMTGRTLLGGQPPKGQQLEDHYFGSIAERVQAFMSEVELELFKLGVPVKTRHNEVAPSQYESAPIFEEADVAVDHNQITMDTLRKVAQRHSFKAVLHEKPFAGINGSGKHCNWSMSICSDNAELNGFNLLNPGNTPHQNLRFLMFLSAVLKGVNDHAGLLRAGIASSGNDHRLGANEAPPAIISVFLGELLSRILNEIESGQDPGKDVEKQLIRLGVNKLPDIAKDNTDRNRTSPFAFTGNKFEFRAVGSSANPAFPITLLNAAVADALAKLTEQLKQRLGSGASIDAAVYQVVRETIKTTKNVRFEGNNYSEEWLREAEKRGLLNLRKSPEALHELILEDAKKMLTGIKVFSEEELHARFHVRMERYVKDLQIELDTLRLMVDTQILPACFSYSSDLAEGVSRMKAAGAGTIPQDAPLKQVTQWMAELQEKRAQLDEVEQRIAKTDDFDKKANIFAVDGVPAFNSVRVVCDQLEGIVDDQYWPLPKYREMLFIA